MIPEGKSGERRYGRWAGNPKGHVEVPDHCVESVYARGRYFSSQCTRKRGFGPEGEYCKQHAKRFEAK